MFFNMFFLIMMEYERMGKKRSFYMYQIKIATDLQDQAMEITSITNASPPVVSTATAHGLADADVVYITGAAHPTANGYFGIKKINDTSFTLASQDFSDLGALGTAECVKVNMSAFCDATSKEENIGSKSFTAVTTNCDDYPQEEGELEAGELSFGLYYDPEEPIQQLFEKQFFSDETGYVQCKPKGVNIVRGYRYAVATFKNSGKVKEKLTGDVSLKLKSKPQDVVLATV